MQQAAAHGTRSQPEQPEDSMRTLLILITLAVIVMVVKRLWLQADPPAKKKEAGGKMVQCGNCGIFFPQSEALERDGHYYCSREHRDASKR